MAERGIFRRAMDVVTGKNAYSPDEAERFIKFMDQSVLDVFVKNPDLVDSPQTQHFYDAVRQAAEELQGRSVRRRRVTRRSLLVAGTAALVSGKFIYDRITYDPEETLAYERANRLAVRDSVLSTNGWQVGYEKFDPALRFVDYTDVPGVWVRNFKSGEEIGLYAPIWVDNTQISPKEFRTSSGEMVPALNVTTQSGSQTSILSTRPIEGLDTEAVRFSKLTTSQGSQPFHAYLSFKMVEASSGVIFEVRLKKRVPAS